ASPWPATTSASRSTRLQTAWKGEPRLRLIGVRVLALAAGVARGVSDAAEGLQLRAGDGAFSEVVMGAALGFEAGEDEREGFVVESLDKRRGCAGESELASEGGHALADVGGEGGLALAEILERGGVAGLADIMASGDDVIGLDEHAVRAS